MKNLNSNLKIRFFLVIINVSHQNKMYEYNLILFIEFEIFMKFEQIKILEDLSS